MPIKKGKDCFGDVMGEFKRGQLHSGKKGPVVKSRDQAKAIAASMCMTEKQKKKEHLMAIGYSEQSAEVIAEGMFPTENFSEGEIISMVRNRIRVMHARLSDIEEAIELAMGAGGEVEMQPWMVDKITLAADYITSVADNALHGDGIEVEIEGEDGEEKEFTLNQLDSLYGEKKGLWDNIHAKRERIKKGSGERMRRPGEKGAPSEADLKAASKDKK
jgi:hypothetical protein